MRPKPAVMGRLSYGHGSPLKSGCQQAGFPPTCGNSKFDIGVLLQWKYCVWQRVISSLWSVRVGILFKVNHQILLHFCHCCIISCMTLFFSSKEISYYFKVLRGLFLKEINVTGNFYTGKKPVFEQDTMKPHGSPCN